MPRRRYATRASESILPPADPAVQRDLAAVRDVVHASLRSDRPEDIFQFALDRVSPVVGASFASVYLVDGASELMQLAAAHNWPEAHRPWLGETRVRVGFGPSGEAASERRTIEIPDVLADAELEDWHEVARELGFRAIVALPMQTAARVLGTVTFYFRDPAGDRAVHRELMAMVADQLAIAAERAALLKELRRANAALAESTGELEQLDVRILAAGRARDEMVTAIAEALADAAASSEGTADLVESLVDLAAVHRGALPLTIDEFDPRVPLRDAIRVLSGVAPAVTVSADEPVLALPLMRSDRKKIARILVSFLRRSARGLKHPATDLRVGVSVANGRVNYRVSDTGDSADLLGDALTDGVSRALGGAATRAAGSNDERYFSLDLPLEPNDSTD